MTLKSSIIFFEWKKTKSQSKGTLVWYKPKTDGTHVRACRAVPQVGDLTQVLGQVVLVVGLVGQLQVPTKRVQPDWISPAALNPTDGIKSNKSSLL